MRRSSLFTTVCAWLGTGAMVCWSGYTLLVANVDADVAAATPLLLTALAALSSVVIVATLAMSLRTVSQGRRLTDHRPEDLLAQKDRRPRN
jgi:membrane protein implicated in regulation of membrane protease activity